MPEPTKSEPAKKTPPAPKKGDLIRRGGNHALVLDVEPGDEGGEPVVVLVEFPAPARIYAGDLAEEEAAAEAEGGDVPA